MQNDSIPDASLGADSPDGRAIFRSHASPPISWRAVRETLGFIGVIGSLIFVGLEIRQNTRVARAEAYRGIEQTLVQWTLSTALDPEIALLMRRVTFDGVRRDELTDTERWQAGSIYDVYLRIVESIFRQVGEGVLPSSALNAYGERSNLMAAPYMRDLWPVIRPNFREDFADYVDRQLAKVP